MSLRDFRKAGHPPTLLSAFLYFDVSFMVWVILGPLGQKQLHGEMSMARFLDDFPNLAMLAGQQTLDQLVIADDVFSHALTNIPRRECSPLILSSAGRSGSRVC